ncbi:MAG: hypothetical protein Tsb0020_03970 [Haliangiales bacterium]
MIQHDDSGYQDLFRGSARLGVLAASSKVPFLHATPLVEAFASELNEYQELSVDDNGYAIGLMTRGQGKGFTFRVARYMEELAVDERELRRFLVRARHFEHRNLFFKVEIGSEGPREISYYFRRRPQLDVVRAWLADSGVDEHGWSRLAECARVLGKRTAHFLAASIRPGQSPTQPLIDKVYFSQPVDDIAWQRMRNAATCWGVESEDWSPLAAHQSSLSPHIVFVSMAFCAGLPVPGVKLDFHQVSPDTVKSLTGNRTATIERFERLRTLFEKQHYDYIGVRIGHGSPIATRAYCYFSSSAKRSR